MRKINCSELGAGHCYFVAKGKNAKDVKELMLEHTKQVHFKGRQNLSEHEMQHIDMLMNKMMS